MTRARVRTTRAFSLIEVLIAVFVLALGLLGLAAVFPVVIVQQRDAVDRSVGLGVARAVEQKLRAGPDVVDWSAMVRDTNFSAHGGPFQGADPCDFQLSYLWDTGLPAYQDSDGSISYARTGNGCDGQALIAGQRPVIPVYARFDPPLFSGQRPQYVWDYVARREPVRGGVQVAVFVRRIDTGIRVPQGSSLSDVLAGSGTDRRLPVAVDSSGRPVTPSGGAGQRYARPVVVTASVDPNQLDRVTLQTVQSGQPPASREAAARVGQKLVDNLGVVRTVTRVIDDLTLEVDPPFSAGNAGTVNVNNPADRASKVQQVAFTPQVPAQVRVFEVSP